MITLDASVVIAMLAGADPHHVDAQTVLALGSDLVIHTVTLAEVLVGGVRISREAEMATRLSDIGIVELARRENEALMLARLRAATGLKLPDCCVLLAAEGVGASVATFDGRLARAARDRGIEVLGAGA